MCASQAKDELMHVHKLLCDFGIKKVPVLLCQDNKATARSLVNRIEDGQSNYLQIHFHYVCERVANREIEVKWVETG